MASARCCFTDIILWCFVAYLSFHVPYIEMRMEETADRYKSVEPPSTEKPEKPEPPKQELKMGKCFHMSREHCPTDGQKCTRIDPASVFCCDVDSFRLKEALQIFVTQNTTNLHVLNATIDELDVSQSTFRRLVSMALTDGSIGKIVAKDYDRGNLTRTIKAKDNDEGNITRNSQFPKHSSVACLNISNNNLSSTTQPPGTPTLTHRPFAYLYNLTILDASANNLTEFPLSLVQSNRQVYVDLSGNNYMPCKHFQKAMEVSNASLVKFLNYNQTFCALDLEFNWFKDVKIVQIDHLRVQKALNDSCRLIKPPGINCTCVPERLELMGDEVTNLVAVDCSRRHLKDLPTDLPPNTVKLNVSYNNITSLQAVGDDPSYDHLRQLIVDYNDIANIVELEGTRFIDNFMLFSISHNKLKTIHTYVLSNKFEAYGPYTTFSIAGNFIHCDCNTEKVLKPWLLENFKNIPDYKSLQCEDGMGAVADLIEYQVCHTPRDWTDYIYYIIGLEVLVLALLVSKVSYDYWVFKTAGYLPWPANKMPRLPCDWLCE